MKEHRKSGDPWNKNKKSKNLLGVQAMRSEYLIKYRYIKNPIHRILQQEFKHSRFFANSEEEALEFFAQDLTDMMAKPGCLIAVPIWIKRMSMGGTKWHNVLTKIEKRR